MVEINKEELRKALEWAVKEFESPTQSPNGGRYFEPIPIIHWFIAGALESVKLMQEERPIHPMLANIMNVYRRAVDSVPTEDSLPYDKSIFQEPSIIDPLARSVGLE